ncbi:hypothetical protein D3C87_1815020 [compost metagenome]
MTPLEPDVLPGGRSAVGNFMVVLADTELLDSLYSIGAKRNAGADFTESGGDFKQLDVCHSLFYQA